MTTYIFFGTALRMLANAYLLSGVLLLAGSYIGLIVIENMEKADSTLPKSKWLT